MHGQLATVQPFPLVSAHTRVRPVGRARYAEINPIITQLFAAIKADDVLSVTQLLHKYPKLIEARDEHDRTPLIAAAHFNKERTFFAIYDNENKPDCAAKTFRGYTALKAAVKHNNTLMIEALEARLPKAPVGSLPKGPAENPPGEPERRLPNAPAAVENLLPQAESSPTLLERVTNFASRFRLPVHLPSRDPA